MLTQTEVRPGSFRPQAMPQLSMRPTCDPASLGAIDLMGFIISYSRNTEVYGEKEPAAYLYKVVRGAVLTYKILENGRRQVAGFYVPGDVFGLETRDRHTLSAETIAKSKLLLISRSELVGLAARDNDVVRQLWTLTAAELRRVQDHVLLFAMPARERVARFHIEMAQRLSAEDELKLPMMRRDIADYLGLRYAVQENCEGKSQAARAIKQTEIRRSGRLGRAEFRARTVLCAYPRLRARAFLPARSLLRSCALDRG